MPFLVLDPSTAAVAPSTTAGAPLVSVGDTLLTMRTELGAELGNRDDVLAPRLNSWINWGYRNVAGMLELNELHSSVALTIVASQPFYLIPVQVASIDRLSVINDVTYPIDGGRELAMIDAPHYRALRALTDEPTSYFRVGRMVVLWPTPLNARSGALDFKVRPDDLVLDTDSPRISVEFHESILLSARHRAFRSLLNFQAAASALNDFLTTIRPLLNTDADERVTQNAGLAPIRRRSDLFRSRD